MMTGDAAGFFPTSDACWLRTARRSVFTGRPVDVIGSGPQLQTLARELTVTGADVRRTATADSAFRFVTSADAGPGLPDRAAREDLARCPDGYALCRCDGRVCIVAGGGDGLLHGYFRILRDRAVPDGAARDGVVLDLPDRAIRMLDHWDNLRPDGMGEVERGYAGGSVFFSDGAVTGDLQRVTDYARLLASVGINALCLNNVNVHDAESRLLVDHLDGVSALAAVFRGYGVRLYASVGFAAPIRVGGLPTADPEDPAVAGWWRGFADAVYAAVPDFGGFVVKADSEGRPGPYSYGRDHAQGANVIARGLARHGGTLFWRCFVYDWRQDWRDRSTDRARAAFDTFMPLDGRFDGNVVLQVKNGPMDFQVREPVSPLLAGLRDTRTALELQITQEYTGQQIDLFHLPTLWRRVLDFDADAGTGRPARTIAAITSGPQGAMVGVANVGRDPSWTGNPLAQANLYGFGRLAWDGTATAASLAEEWAALTFPDAGETGRATVCAMLLRSADIYEGYTAPLGVGWMVTPHTHYGPAVDGYEYAGWGTYHFADRDGIGVDRTTTTGTGFAGQYPAGWARVFDGEDSCPDELLLFFHHVGYTHVLHSGKTVIQHIYDSHFDGHRGAQWLLRSWAGLRDVVDPARHRAVQDRLERQVHDAREWRDQVVTYFLRKSGIPDARDRIAWR